MKARQWRKTWWSSDAIFTRDCSFSSSLYARLERTENPSFSSKNRVSSACFWRFSQPDWPHKKQLCPGRVRPVSRGRECPGPGVWWPEPGHSAPAPACEQEPGPPNCFYRLQWEPSRSQTDNPFFAHHEIGKIGHQGLKTGVTELFFCAGRVLWKMSKLWIKIILERACLAVGTKSL